MVVPQHAIDIAITRLGGLVIYLDFLADLSGVRAVGVIQYRSMSTSQRVHFQFGAIYRAGY